VQPLDLLNRLRYLKRKTSPKASSAKVAIGYNACLDAVVDAFEFFDKLNAEHPEDRKNHPEVHSIEQLAEVFHFHFTKAAAAERAVCCDDVFEEFSHALFKSKHKLHLGGNAAIMAVVFAKRFGFQNVVLAGQVGEKIKGHLPDNLKTINAQSGKISVSGEDVSIQNDEVHIIMEYSKGSSWPNAPDHLHHTAKRANRFIVSRDTSNGVIAPLEVLGEYTANSPDGLDLVIICGLHMLDGKEKTFYTSRLADVEKSMGSMTNVKRIHFELASVGDLGLLKEMTRKVLPLSDSLGLNEEELVSLIEVMGLSGFDTSKIAAQIPDVVVCASALEAILRKMNESPRKRNLSRIHFHNFAFHIMVQMEGTGGNLLNWAEWEDARSALAAGSVEASERACNSTSLGNDQISLHLNPVLKISKEKTLHINANKPIVEWVHHGENGNTHFYVAPVLACNKVVQTVGLGDSISSSGLAYQI